MAKYSDVPIGQSDEFDGHLLLIHQTALVDTEDRTLVILIHGLNGSAYRTWNGLLGSDWMKSQKQFDVGVVDHVSGFRRFRTTPRPDPRAIAGALASEIRQLRYRRVLLVGHSMGGLIAKDAVRELFLGDALSREYVDRIQGIVTLCTPSTGAGLARVLAVARLGKDYRVLRRHSELQSDLDEFFSTNVNIRIDDGAEADGDGRLRVPVFGASARADRVVPQMGAELGLPVNQRAILSGNHRSVLAYQQTFEWVKSSLETLGSRLPQHSARRASLYLVTSFAGSASSPSWAEAYARALEVHSNTSPVAAFDRTAVEVGGNAAQHLRLRAFDASLALSVVPSEVRSDVSAQDGGSRRTALGICPVGEDANAAVNQLTAKCNAPELRWFRAAKTDAEVLDAFVQFMDLAVKSLGVWPRSVVRPVGRLADED